MVLKYIEGDIFNSPAQVLVNTVNTVGVMGKGIALKFKTVYPDMFAAYRKACDKHRLVIGRLMIWYGPDHWVLLFPTKEHWRNPSKLEYIERGLITFVRKYSDYNITSIAFPKLGCGNGELDWSMVKPLMEKYLKNLPIDIYIYLGSGKDPVPEHRAIKDMNKWLKEHAKDMSFTGVKDDIILNSVIVPITFFYQNEKWEARFNKTEAILEFVNGNASCVVISEEHFQKIWDNIQKSEVFEYSNNQKEDLVFCLLESLGYLTFIRVKDETSNEMKDGFQLDSGKGRYFMVKG